MEQCCRCPWIRLYLCQACCSRVQLHGAADAIYTSKVSTCHQCVRNPTYAESGTGLRCAAHPQTCGICASALDEIFHPQSGTRSSNCLRPVLYVGNVEVAAVTTSVKQHCFGRLATWANLSNGSRASVRCDIGGQVAHYCMRTAAGVSKRLHLQSIWHPSFAVVIHPAQNCQGKALQGMLQNTALAKA